MTSGGRLDKDGLVQATIYAAQIFAKNGFDNFKFIFLDSKANSSIALNWYDLYLAVRYMGPLDGGGRVTSTSGIPAKSINHININSSALEGERNFLYGVGYLMAHEMLHSILHQTYYHFTKDWRGYHTDMLGKLAVHNDDFPNLNMSGPKLVSDYGGIPKYPSEQLRAAERITFDHKWWILVLSRVKR